MSHLSLNLHPSNTNTLWYTPIEHDHDHEHDHEQAYPFMYNDANSSKEHMFEKALTPSDVGKLNRLVIPKQHAEKYFPLAAATKTTTIEGGMLLGFEDEEGKCWRFRYSYWNSSQSYVLTKGWSRFVKDNNLNASDVVLFHRHRLHLDRFYIGCRRRDSDDHPTVVKSSYDFNEMSSHHQRYEESYHKMMSFSNNISPRSLNHGPNQVRQKPKKSGSVRLFGVNLECELEEDHEDNEEPKTSDSHGSTHPHAFSFHYMP